MATRKTTNPNFSEEQKSVELARAKEGLARDKELADLAEILKDERVRDFLWRVMSRGDMFGEPFNNNFGVTGHNCGRAAVAKFVLDEILQADYNAWLVMQKRHYERQIEEMRLAALEQQQRAS